MMFYYVVCYDTTGEQSMVRFPSKELAKRFCELEPNAAEIIVGEPLRIEDL